jgi:hypothetical protein
MWPRKSRAESASRIETQIARLTAGRTHILEFPRVNGVQPELTFAMIGKLHNMVSQNSNDDRLISLPIGKTSHRVEPRKFSSDNPDQPAILLCSRCPINVSIKHETPPERSKSKTTAVMVIVSGSLHAATDATTTTHPAFSSATTTIAFSDTQGHASSC